MIARAPEYVPFAERRPWQMKRQAEIDAAHFLSAQGADFVRRNQASALSQRAEQAAELLQSEVSDVAACRANGEALSAWVRSWGDPEHIVDRELLDWADSEARCHVEGSWGIDGDAGRVRMHWDHKCGNSHLCQWEIRQEQARLAKRYADVIARWSEASPLHRVFYAVFTVPNVAPGRLIDGKEGAWSRWCAWHDATQPVTDDARKRYGYGPRKRAMPAWRAVDGRTDGICGALVSQEDPLSKHRDWNIHQNAVLLVRGPFDFEQVRATWGYDVELRQVDSPREIERHGGLAAAIAAQIAEVLKYIAKGAAGETGGFREWGPELFREWYHAQKGRRRVRSYGALNGIKDEDESEGDQTFWCGSIWWQGGSYRVGLVSDDKFLCWAPGGGHQFGPRAPP